MCTPAKITTANPVGFGIYGEASSVTDTTVPLNRITSVTASQGRTRPSVARSNTVQATLLEWWSVWWYAPLKTVASPSLGSAATTQHKLSRLVPDHCPGRRGYQGGVVMASPIIALCDSRGRTLTCTRKSLMYSSNSSRGYVTRYYRYIQQNSDIIGLVALPHVFRSGNRRWRG